MPAFCFPSLRYSPGLAKGSSGSTVNHPDFEAARQFLADAYVDIACGMVAVDFESNGDLSFRIPVSRPIFVDKQPELDSRLEEFLQMVAFDRKVEMVFVFFVCRGGIAHSWARFPRAGSG